MSDRSFYAAQGGLPLQTDLLTDRAAVAQTFTFKLKGVFRDIVSNSLPMYRPKKDWIEEETGD